MNEFRSTTGTPLYYTAELVRKADPEAVTVFISPCVAKRKEAMDNDNVSYVMTYEELGALFIAKKIEIAECDEDRTDSESSKQARNFGNTAGVAEAVKSVIKDKEQVKPYIISGLTKETAKELKKFVKDKKCPDCNLVEVMCCEGGCVGGNATLNLPRIARKQLKTLLDESQDLKRED